MLAMAGYKLSVYYDYDDDGNPGFVCEFEKSFIPDVETGFTGFDINFDIALNNAIEKTMDYIRLSGDPDFGAIDGFSWETC